MAPRFHFISRQKLSACVFCVCACVCMCIYVCHTANMWFRFPLWTQGQTHGKGKITAHRGRCGSVVKCCSPLLHRGRFNLLGKISLCIFGESVGFFCCFFCVLKKTRVISSLPFLTEAHLDRQLLLAGCLHQMPAYLHHPLLMFTGQHGLPEGLCRR